MKKFFSGSLMVVVPMYPPVHSGGGLRIHRQYVRIRDRLGVPLRVLSAAGRGVPPGVLEEDGILVFRMKSKPFLFLFLQMGLRFWMDRPAALHCAGDTPFNYAAALWALLLRIPLIKERTMNSGLTGDIFRRFLFNIVHRNAVLCIALNRSIEKQFLRSGAEPDRVFFRPSPVDCSVFRKPVTAEKAAACRELGLQASGPVHLVVGRFCSRKNQMAAVDALASLSSDNRLILAGPVLDEDDEVYLKELRTRAERLRLSSRVLFLPEAVENVLKLYHAADSLWIPSVAEGTPNVMLEALCTGIPVLTNRILDLDDFIKDGENGLQVQFESAGFAVDLQALLAKIDRDTVAGEAGRRYSAGRIDEQFFERLSAVLRKRK
jgi:glycosyltransferase involved in cell wall biosynthesis